MAAGESREVIRELEDMARDAHRRSVALLRDLTPEQLIGPYLPTINPPLWEIGHAAWFHEYFNLRQGSDGSVSPSMLENADALYDSMAVEHTSRWHLDLPSWEETLAYKERVLERVLARLRQEGPDPERVHRFKLTIFHEDMHGEAFMWMRQRLGYPAPDLGERPAAAPDPQAGAPLPGDVTIPGGEYLLGAPADMPFVFDNEKWAHRVRVEPFRIARAAVTNEAYAAFVADGGYRHREFWSKEGWAWREQAGAEHPVYWLPDGAGGWLQRRFDRLEPLSPCAPVIHVNWFEAEAYCRWAGRRLPTEAEWEVAASTEPAPGGHAFTGRKRTYPWGEEPPQARHGNFDGFALGCAGVAAHPEGDSAWGCRQMLGNVWEWCADPFRPFPGFAPDVYESYSAPWFDDRKVLRGGSWVTRSRILWNTHRNFFTPDRNDIFAGFRTCARE